MRSDTNALAPEYPRLIRNLPIAVYSADYLLDALNVEYQAAMRFKLRVVAGAMLTADGRSRGAEIPIPVRRFFIGTAPDCHMRCSGQSISPHHCMILIEDDRVIVRDDASQGGTFVNGQRIDTTACLFHGDRMRVGKLEFEVLMPASRVSGTEPEATPEPEIAHKETVTETTDTIANFVVDMLLTEDEADRDRRRFDPAAREFHVEPHTSAEKPASPPPEKSKVPPKRPPAKLPPPPPVRGNDTVDAAEQALTQLLNTSKKKN